MSSPPSFYIQLIAIHWPMCPTQQFLQTLVSCLQLPCGILLIPSLHFPYSLSIPGFPVAIGRPCSHMQTLIFTLSPPPSQSLSLSFAPPLLLERTSHCFSLPHTLYMQLTCSALSNRHQLHPARLQYWWRKHYWAAQIYWPKSESPGSLSCL